MHSFTGTDRPLHQGDVVSFRFPLDENPRQDPKARPCLILKLENGPSGPEAVVAYGTTRKTRSNVGMEIRISRAQALSAAGLDEPTRFVGRRRVQVALDDRRFVASAETGSAVLGHLGADEMRRLERIETLIRLEEAGLLSAPRRRGRGLYAGQKPLRLA